MITKVLNLVKENPNLSNRELGKILGISRSTIQYYLNKLNIHRNRKIMQKLNNTKREKILHISDNAEQIILGSILGDGYIAKFSRPEDTKKLLNSYLAINHSIKQESYIKYKQCLLEKEQIKCYLILQNYNYQHYIKNKLVLSGNNYILRTQRNVIFNKYRTLYYKNNIKYINRYTYKIKPLALAIWYMDDGYFSNNNYHLCTNGFSFKDVQLLQKILKHNFNLDTTIQKSNIGQPILYIKSNSKNTFEKLICPYICDSMKYKLRDLTS